jgi:N6-L-threonylcarbamoyladenine synthase
MRALPVLTRRCQQQISRCVQRRNLLTLAIETSCDDTSVAVLEKHQNNTATLHFNHKITSDNRHLKGISPIIAHESHQTNLAKLVNVALEYLPVKAADDTSSDQTLMVKDHHGKTQRRKKPDFVTVTRGPGMRANLITGMDTAKGLAVAWQVPFLGVHHMQAHALTPRMVTALEITTPKEHHGIAGILDTDYVEKPWYHKIHQQQKQLLFAPNQELYKLDATPAFPFLSLLVSGGHTMLVLTKGLCDHEILAQTTDIAIGDYIDKVARDILPPRVLKSSKSVMYGPTLEYYAYPDTGKTNDYNYRAPTNSGRRKPNKSNEVSKTLKPRDWDIPPPLTKTKAAVTHNVLAKMFSFSGMGSSVKAIVERNPEMEDGERRLLAREAMRVAFEHLGSRVLTALKKSHIELGVNALVVSGGVASNQYLKHILRAMLDSQGYEKMNLVFPPPEFCVDNAAMIAWAGIEMWEAGYRTRLSALAEKKWSLDPEAKDGGILGLPGWVNMLEEGVVTPKGVMPKENLES